MIAKIPGLARTFTTLSLHQEPRDDLDIERAKGLRLWRPHGRIRCATYLYKQLPMARARSAAIYNCTPSNDYQPHHSHDIEASQPPSLPRPSRASPPQTYSKLI